MKPDWAALIKQHTRPSRDKNGGGNALTLRKGVVGVSIAAGSAREHSAALTWRLATKC